VSSIVHKKYADPDRSKKISVILTAVCHNLPLSSSGNVSVSDYDGVGISSVEKKYMHLMSAGRKVFYSYDYDVS